jgi:hypothetical protein
MPRLSEADGGKLPPVYYKHRYSTHEEQELARCANDLVYFVENYVKIQHPVRGAIRFNLFPYQVNLLRTYEQNMRVVALLRRQSGKTTTAAAFLLWWIIFKKDQKVLVTRKDQTGANEIMSRFWYAYEELPWWMKPSPEKNDITHKKFRNKREIRALATTETTGRGLSISLLYLDEFAFVRPSVATKFWASIFPVISTGGKAIITRTPNTDEDKFAQIFMNANPVPISDTWVDPMAERVKHAIAQQEQVDYKTEFEDKLHAEFFKSTNVIDAVTAEDETIQEFRRFFSHWTNTPDRDGKPRGERFRKEMMSSGLTEAQWLSEFECAFVSTESTLISAPKLASLKFFIREPRYVDKYGVRWFEEVKPNTAYAVTLDPSEGVDLDDACIQVWEIPTLIQVAEWNSNKVDQPGQVKVLRRVLKTIKRMQDEFPEHDGVNNTYFSVERNGVGVGIINIIELTGIHRFQGWFIDASEATIHQKGLGNGQQKINRWRGLFMSAATKKRFALQFKSLIERNIFVPRRKYLVSQLKTFVRQGNMGFGAKEGSKDDIVMRCVIMTALLDELYRQEPDLEDRIAVEDLELPYDPDDMQHDHNMPLLPIV